MSAVIQSSRSALIPHITKTATRQTSPSTFPATRPEPEDAVFSKQQVREFHADDAAAMGTIAKIMTTLFTYTVVIMSVVILWTFAVVS